MPAKMTAERAIEQIEQAMNDQQPHCRNMPGNGTTQPETQGRPNRKAPAKNRRRIVDGPAAHEHADHGDSIEPMRKPDRQRVQQDGPGREATLTSAA